MYLYAVYLVVYICWWYVIYYNMSITTGMKLYFSSKILPTKGKLNMLSSCKLVSCIQDATKHPKKER